MFTDGRGGANEGVSVWSNTGYPEEVLVLPPSPRLLPIHHEKKNDVAVFGRAMDSISLNEGSRLDADRAEMLRMGKEQEFRRVFNPVSVFGFSCIYVATWEYLLVSVESGLINGGFAGLIYEYIATIIAFGAVVLSLAEMASMAPTDGASYHWVSEFAPPRFQKHLSYVAGWTSTLGWLAGQTTGFFLLYELTQAMINVYMPDFEFLPWQATLVMIAYILVTVLFNTWGARLLPALETFSSFLHLAGFLITIIPLWVMVKPEDRNSVEDVFTTFSFTGGWASNGFSALVGTVAIIFATLGPDAAVHVAEETENAGRIIPLSMVGSYYLNAVLGFVALVTMLFTVGSLEEAIESDAPFANAFARTGSPGMNLLLILILWALIAIGNVTAVATTSREFFAFSRDKGMPLWRWMSRVDTRLNVPANSVLVVTVLSSALCLINLGSEAAFNIIVSLNVTAFFFTYILAIGCLLWRRWFGAELPRARWSLGQWGLPINLFAIGYSCLGFVLSCLPTAVPVTDAGEGANFAPAIFVGTLVVAAIAYAAQGRHIYEGPVVHTEGHRDAGAELQTSRG